MPLTLQHSNPIVELRRYIIMLIRSKSIRCRHKGRIMSTDKRNILNPLVSEMRLNRFSRLPRMIVYNIPHNRYTTAGQKRWESEREMQMQMPVSSFSGYNCL